MAQKTAKSDVWTAEERAAMKEAVAEAKRAAKRGADNAAGEADVLAKIAEMPEPDRSMAARIHEIVEAVWNVDLIEAQLRAGGATEVDSSEVGKMAMAKLRALDQIAYIRFASVYQSFEDIETLKREVDNLYAQRESGATVK